MFACYLPKTLFLVLLKNLYTSKYLIYHLKNDFTLSFIINCHIESLQILLSFDVSTLFVYLFLNRDSNPNTRPEPFRLDFFSFEKITFFHMFARFILFLENFNLAFVLRSSDSFLSSFLRKSVSEHFE